MPSRRYEKARTSITKCICPRCNRKHKMRLFWTGKGTPKKHCKNCKREIEDLSNDPLLNNYKLKGATKIYIY
jgi:transposase-like protein